MVKKEVILVKPRGFCAGVVRAVDIVELAIQRFGKPVYCKHAVVHNEAVVKDLEAKGAVFVESADEVPEGATVVFSAHGSPPEDFAAAQRRQLRVIDATCPLVTKVHNEARKYGAEGRVVIVVGHEGHVEVKGTVGQALAAHSTVELLDPDHPDLTRVPDVPVVVLTQTTLSQDDVAPAIAEVRRRFPDAIVRDDICYATTNRQEAVKRLAQEADLVLVIGSHESSNSKRLAEVSRRHGTPAYLVASAAAVPWFWVRGATRVGVTSGASTPERLVEEVVQTLERSGFSRSELEVVPEDITFKLPKDLE